MCEQLNFTQFATRRGYVDDYSVLDHNDLSPSGHVSKRGRKAAQDRQQDRAMSNIAGHVAYQAAIDAGDYGHNRQAQALRGEPVLFAGRPVGRIAVRLCAVVATARLHGVGRFSRTIETTWERVNHGDTETHANTMALGQCRESKQTRRHNHCYHEL